MELIGLLSFLLARNVYMFFLARAFMGMASGAIAGPASALLFTYNRKTGAVLTSIGTSVGTATGPLVGGIMAQYLPYPLRLVYVISIIFVTVPALAMSPLKDISKKNPELKLHFPSVDREVIKPFLLSSFLAFIARKSGTIAMKNATGSSIEFSDYRSGNILGLNGKYIMIKEDSFSKGAAVGIIKKYVNGKTEKTLEKLNQIIKIK